MIPTPPNTMSSPGPPNVSPATVSSQHHNGNAAIRGADVHCSAAHTSAALTRPLISALIGKGTDPIRRGRKNAAATAESTPSIARQCQDDGTQWRQVGMLSNSATSDPITH